MFLLRGALFLFVASLVVCGPLARGANPAAGPRRALPGLVPAPRLLPGVGRWQLAHKIPRGRIYAVAWSPDGKKIAYAESAYIRICDAQSFETEQVLVGHNDRVTSIDWCRATNRIASAGFDGTTRIWSPDGVVQKVVKGRGGEINAVAWTKDGARLASAGSDGTVLIVNADGSPVRTIEASAASVNCVTWSPDGSLLATGDDDHQVKIWRGDGRLNRVCEGHLARVTAIAWSPDGKRLGSATIGYQPDDPDAPRVADIRLWSADGSPTGSRTSAEASFGLQWAPDSGLLVVASESGNLQFLAPNGDVSSIQTIPNIPRQMTLFPLAISPDGNEIAVGGTGGISVVAIKNAAKSRSSRQTLIVNRRYLDAIAVSPDRTRLILRIPDANSRILYLNLSTGFTVDVPGDLADSRPTEHSFNPVDNRIVFAADRAQLSIWNPEKGTTDVVTRSKRPIAASAWSPLGDRIAYCDDEHAIHVVKSDGTPVVELPAKPAPVVPVGTTSRPLELQFSRDANAIFLAEGTHVEVRRLSGGAAATFNFGGSFERYWVSADYRQAAATHMIVMENHSFSLCSANEPAQTLTDLGVGIDSLDCNRDVTRLVVGYTNGNWVLRRLDNGATAPREVLAHTNATLMASTFSPDGERIATGGWDAVVKIWKLDGTLERTLFDNTDPLYQVWWSRDGKRLLSTARDGTICRWSAADGRLESLTFLTVPGHLMHVGDDGRIASQDAAAVAEELIVLVEKPNGSMEIVEYPEFLKRTGQNN